MEKVQPVSCEEGAAGAVEEQALFTEGLTNLLQNDNTVVPNLKHNVHACLWSS